MIVDVKEGKIQIELRGSGTQLVFGVLPAMSHETCSILVLLLTYLP